MKKIILILIILMSMVGNGFAEEENPYKWTKEDTILQGIFITTLAIDMWYTYTFLYTGNYRERGIYETNPILGKYPSKNKLYLYSISGAILHTGITYILPKPYRNMWQSFWIGGEMYAINYSYSLGIKLKF